MSSDAPDIVASLEWIKEQGQCDCSICDTAWRAAEKIKEMRRVGDRLAMLVDQYADISDELANSILKDWEGARCG